MSYVGENNSIFFFSVSKNCCYQTSTKVPEMAELCKLEFSSTCATSTVTVLCERDPGEAGGKLQKVSDFFFWKKIKIKRPYFQIMLGLVCVKTS